MPALPMRPVRTALTMQREELVDLNAFVVIAEEQSFTRASARLGTSQSALSHTVKRLEARLGVRLLHRTTRSVSTTDAGAQLLASLRGAFADIAGSLSAVSHLGSEPGGTIRLTASEHATDTVLWPKLNAFLRLYPQVKLEIDVNQAGFDIAKEGFDAGVRLGHEIANDMISVRISADVRKVYVASPQYLAGKEIPQHPHDVLQHSCIAYRRPMTGRIAPWTFSKAGESFEIRPEGRLVFNIDRTQVDAAVDGYGITCVVEERVTSLVDSGRLVRLLDDWTPPMPGLYLYYPSRRENSAAFKKMVEHLRHG
jgi:DNA-binding transcriptional LysR family regulator